MKGRAVQSFVWIMKFDADTSPQGKRVRGCLIFHMWRLSVSFCVFNTSVRHSERSTIDLDAISLNLLTLVPLIQQFDMDVNLPKRVQGKVM